MRNQSNKLKDIKIKKSSKKPTELGSAQNDKSNQKNKKPREIANTQIRPVKI